jgi:NADH dehydrogenase FAD-containing subunit
VYGLFNLNAIFFITVGVKEHAFFMKEVDDGVKVQKRILERLEAASAILFARQKRVERNIKQWKSHGKLETPTPDQIESINTAMAEEKAIKANEDLEISRLLHWIVVGAGPTGVELCAEMSDFVR